MALDLREVLHLPIRRKRWKWKVFSGWEGHLGTLALWRQYFFNIFVQSFVMLTVLVFVAENILVWGWWIPLRWCLLKVIIIVISSIIVSLCFMAIIIFGCSGDLDVLCDIICFLVRNDMHLSYLWISLPHRVSWINNLVVLELQNIVVFPSLILACCISLPLSNKEVRWRLIDWSGILIIIIAHVDYFRRHRKGGLQHRRKVGVSSLAWTLLLVRWTVLIHCTLYNGVAYDCPCTWENACYLSFFFWRDDNIVLILLLLLSSGE